MDLNIEHTTLETLSKLEELTYLEFGFISRVPMHWILEGENRVSYTALIRMAECCREYHWQKDIKPYVPKSLDSTLKNFEAEFFKPLPLQQDICVLYNVGEVRNKGYSLHIRVLDHFKNDVYAKLAMVCVFYDLQTGVVTAPSLESLDNLRRLIKIPM